MAKKANPTNLTKPKPNQDQFLLKPNFSHLIFYTFVTIPHQHCTNTITSLIHQLCYQRHKKPIKDQYLLQANFSHLIFYAFVTIPHQDCTKTITSLIHQFCYQRHKKPIHRTWLSQNPTMIHSFCKETFHTSFFMYLWQLPNKIAQKSDLHLFTNFATKAKKTNPPNLAKPKPNHDPFLLQANFSHLIFYAFVTIAQQDCTKIVSSLIHQFCYQCKKNQSTELG